MVPGQNIDQLKNVDATYPQMAARFFWKQEQQRKLFFFQTLSMLGSSKRNPNIQRSLNWATTFLGWWKKLAKKNSSDVSPPREDVAIDFYFHVLMAWRSTAPDPCLS